MEMIDHFAWDRSHALLIDHLIDITMSHTQKKRQKDKSSLTNFLNWWKNFSIRSELFQMNSNYQRVYCPRVHLRVSIKFNASIKFVLMELNTSHGT